MNDNKVQKLSDEALDEVAGGKSGRSRPVDEDAAVFAEKIGPELRKLAEMVKTGVDRNTVWGQNCLHIQDLIDIYLSSGTRFNLVFAKQWFEACCSC